MKRILIVLLTLAGAVSVQVDAAQQNPMQARRDLASTGLNYSNGNQFLQAIANGDRPAVELFIAGQGFDINAPYKVPRGVNVPNLGHAGGGQTAQATPLLVAQVTNRPEIVDRLIKAGAEPKEQNLKFALSRRDLAQAGMFLESPALKPGSITAEMIYKTIATGVTPGDAKIVDRLLVKAGTGAKVIVNSVHDQMRYPYPTRALTLATAFHTKDNDLLGILIKHGAEVDAIDPVIIRKDNLNNKHPRTALMNAIEVGNADAVEKLLSIGANPNIVVVQENLGISFTSPFARRTALDFADWVRRPKSPERHEAIKTMVVKAGGKTYKEIQAGGTKGQDTTNLTGL